MMEFFTMKITTGKFTTNSSWKIYIIFSACAILLSFMPEAGATDAISSVLCRVSKLLTGGIGQAVATIGIVVLGMGLFTGKLSWTTAIATALGIGIIFGAGTLVNSISPSGSTTCST
jgi:type IV secretory pathway VirB2 component (pilin)